jgi:chloramphenicol 3-O phosphotransferase
VELASGRVVVLNGTSSSGKSTLAKALQARLDEPWLLVGIDTVVFALPGAWLDPPRWADVFRYVEPAAGAPAGVTFRIETGPLGLRLVDGLHRAVAALADAGLSVIVDHVLVEPGWLPDLAGRLDGHEVLFVGVRCPLDVVMRREAERRDRTVGQAAAQFDVVHSAGGYDLEVDTSRLTPEEAAERIASSIAGGFPATPFGRLRGDPTGTGGAAQRSVDHH